MIYTPRAVKYTDDPLCLGKYVVTAIDEGSAMTNQILQHNDTVVTNEKTAYGQVQLDMYTSRESIEERLEKKINQNEFEEVGIPETLEHYHMQMRIKTSLHSLTWTKRSHPKLVMGMHTYL